MQMTFPSGSIGFLPIPQMVIKIANTIFTNKNLTDDIAFFLKYYVLEPGTGTALFWPKCL
jgi:hypothetical protein